MHCFALHEGKEQDLLIRVLLWRGVDFILEHAVWLKTHVGFAADQYTVIWIPEKFTDTAREIAKGVGYDLRSPEQMEYWECRGSRTLKATVEA